MNLDMPEWMEQYYGHGRMNVIDNNNTDRIRQDRRVTLCDYRE